MLEATFFYGVNLNIQYQNLSFKSIFYTIAAFYLQCHRETELF